MLIAKPRDTPIVAKTVEKWVKSINDIDSLHPTFIVHYLIYKLEIYEKISDIFGVDPYPVSRISLEHVDILVSRAVELMAPRPIWLIAQAFRFARPTDKGDWAWKRFPDAKEEKIMVFKGLSKNAKGVLYYTYSSFVSYSPNPVEGLISTNVNSLYLKRGIANISFYLNVFSEPFLRSDRITYLWNQWTRSGLVDCELLLSGLDTILMVLVNRNHISDEYKFKISPVDEVKVRVMFPEWFRVKDSFRLTLDRPVDIGFKFIKRDSKGRESYDINLEN